LKTKALAYWTATAIITLELIAGGVTDLAHGRAVLIAGQPVVEVLEHLGYPTYLLAILGVWKVLGAAALLAPGLPRLKEWAYAGTFFELTGAALSALAVGDSLDSIATPCFFAACAVASWALRPQSRTLGVLSLPFRHPPRPAGSTSRRGVPHQQ
jgi:hypothetical protein